MVNFYREVESKFKNTTKYHQDTIEEILLFLKQLGLDKNVCLNCFTNLMEHGLECKRTK